VVGLSLITLHRRRTMDPRRDEFSVSVEENVRDIIYHVYCTSVLYLRLMSGHTLSIQPYRRL